MRRRLKTLVAVEGLIAVLLASTMVVSAHVKVDGVLMAVLGYAGIVLSVLCASFATGSCEPEE